MDSQRIQTATGQFTGRPRRHTSAERYFPRPAGLSSRTPGTDIPDNAHILHLKMKKDTLRYILITDEP